MKNMLRCPMLLIADAINISVDGKLNILGEFNSIRTTGLPYLMRTMAIATRITGPLDGQAEHTVQIDLQPPGDRPIATLTSTKFRLEGDVEIGGAFQLFGNIPGILLLHEGVYRFKVIVDGNQLAETPLLVKVTGEGSERRQ